MFFKFTAAEAICEAVQRPTMRFVPVKTADQQAAVLLHRGRERLVRQRTGLVNALRGHLAEFGVIAPQGLRNVGKLIAIVRDKGDARLPDLARQVLQVLAAQIEQLEAAGVALGGGFVNLTGGGSPNFFDPIGGDRASGANSVAIGAEHELTRVTVTEVRGLHF
jgi:transposase